MLGQALSPAIIQEVVIGELSHMRLSLNTGTWTANMLLNSKKTIWKLFSRRSEGKKDHVSLFI